MESAKDERPIEGRMNKESVEKVLTALEAILEVGTILDTRSTKARVALAATKAAIKAIKASLARREMYVIVDNTKD
jgi:hypothetical protein